MQLKILLVTTHYGPKVRETPLANELAASLAKQGHGVQVVAIRWSATPGGPTRRYTDESGVDVVAIAPRSIGRNSGRTYRASKWLFTPIHSYRELRRELAGQRYDCLIGFSPAVALSGAFLWGLPRSARSLLYVTDFFPFHHRSLGLVPPGPVFQIAHWLENNLIRRFGSVVCMSRAGVDYLRRNYDLASDQTVLAVPLWSNIAVPDFPGRADVRAKYDLPIERPIVLFGGQIAEGRGIEEILAAANLARRRSPDILFLMVGQGRLEHLVRAYLADGGDNLVLLGPLARDDYVALVSACDVGIVCTVPGVDVPTFPSKTLDYLRAGVPVVASVEATTDYREFVEEQGFGIAGVAGDPARLLGGIARILDSPELARAMVASGRKTLAEVFDVDRAANRLIEGAS
jgi:glycosyltransferase involved in cell wall biosynthesis